MDQRVRIYWANESFVASPDDWDSSVFSWKIKARSGVDFSKLRFSPFVVGIPPQAEICPVCKTLRSQIAITSYVGCPACYDVFSDTIDELFPK
jgi:hypothetical protein